LYESANLTPPIEVVVKDEAGSIITRATLAGNITFNNTVTPIEFSETPEYYVSTFRFEEAGQYVVNVTASKGNLSAYASRTLTIGLQAGALQDLSLNIITPLPRVYPENTAPAVRARVSLSGRPVTDAIVLALLNSIEYPMTYVQFGEYTVSLPALQEGAYSLYVIASVNNSSTEDKVEFAVSKKRLLIELITPNESAEVVQKSGEAVTVAFNVKNERGDLEPNVQVEVTFLAPSGRRSVAQAFQSLSGEYSTQFFATDTGIHSYNVTADKAGFVPGFFQSDFRVTLEKQSFLFGWDTQTLLNVLLVVAILILIAAAFRAVF
ncbi:hypothetical protein HY546_02100, partial [archaeon]|nr:hypothetical protein [archaeon]